MILSDGRFLVPPLFFSSNVSFSSSAENILLVQNLDWFKLFCKRQHPSLQFGALHTIKVMLHLGLPPRRDWSQEETCDFLPDFLHCPESKSRRSRFYVEIVNASIPKIQTRARERYFCIWSGGMYPSRTRIALRSEPSARLELACEGHGELWKIMKFPPKMRVDSTWT